MSSRNRTILDLPALPALSALSDLSALSALLSLPALLAASALFAAPAFGQGPGREGGREARPGAAEAFAERMMTRDVNRDGKLTIEEMDPLNGKTIMDRADTNKDGFLTREELIAMINARIAGSRGPAQDGDANHDEDEESAEEISYHDAMEQAGRGLRGLRRSPMDETSRSEDLEAVHTIQLGLLLAKSRVDSVDMSENAQKIFGTNSAEHHKAMRLALIKVFIKALELEYAIAEGNTERAKEAYDAIREMRADAHDTFEPEEDEEHDHDDPAQHDDSDGHNEGGGGS